MVENKTGKILIGDGYKLYLPSFPYLNIEQDIQLNVPRDCRVNAAFH